MRIDERIASGSEPSFSFEFFPPKTDEGERNLGRALAELSRLSPTFVSVTYGAGGSATERRKTIDIVAHLKRDYGMESMAHFTCVGATTEELRTMLGTMRDAGVENVLALRGDPPAGETEWTPTEGGLSYSRELIELIRDEYDFAIGAACFPEVHIHADGRRERPALPQGEGRRRRALPDHAAVLRQPVLLRLRRPRAGPRDRRADHPRHLADHEREPDQARHRAVRLAHPRRSAARARAARRPARARSPTSASPTRRSSAPTCWPTAPPGSTSTRSTARPRRGRSSPRCASWRRGATPSRPSL